MTSIAEIVRIAREAEQDAADRQAAAAAQRAKADQAAAKANEAVAEATAAERAAPLAPTTALMGVMRALTDEVRQARATAAEAVRTGDQPVLEAWLTYRRTRAGNIGKWDSMRSMYGKIAGRVGPPGDWGPRAVGTATDGDHHDPEESFADFLAAAVREAERAIRAEAAQGVWAEVEQASG